MRLMSRCVYVQERRQWEVKLQVWNGIEYPQSRGIHIVADSCASLTSNALHWLGITAPYAPYNEELEGAYPVRIARYRDAHSGPVEESIVELAKLTGTGGELYDIATKCEAELARTAA